MGVWGCAAVDEAWFALWPLHTSYTDRGHYARGDAGLGVASPDYSSRKLLWMARRARFRPMVLTRWFAAGCACWLVVACGKRGPRVAELAAAAEPRVDEFARFEVWAHRAQDAVHMDQENSELALREATFAPIRHQRHVLFALVEHRARVVRNIALPAGTELPPQIRFAPVSTPTLARIEAALQYPCRVALPSWWREGAGSGPCLILSRESEREGGETLRVTVGYGLRGAASSTAQIRADEHE